MSARRSRSGGGRDRHDLEAVEEVLPEWPAPTASSRDRFVAATTRRSSRSGAVFPQAADLAVLERAQELPLGAGA